jgi:hypothetical protein
MRLFSRLCFVLCAFLIPASAFATDLTIGHIVSPFGELAKGKAVPVTFWVRNINRLDATQFTLTVTIKKKGSSTPVYTSTFEKSALPKYDSASYTAPTAFTPPDTGLYDITINVNYSDDIDHSNDTRTETFHVTAPPNLGTRVRQFSYFGPTGDSQSTIGIIEFTIPPTTKPCFINVLIKRNDTSQAVWIVRNLLYIGPDFTPQNPIGQFVDFARLGFKPGESIDSAILCISCSDVPLTDPPQPDVTCQYFPVKPDIYAVGPGSIETATTTLPGPFSTADLPTFLPTLAHLTDTVERGCTVPNIDLDSQTYNASTVPGYAGDWNACGPTSAANSMQWMEDAHMIPAGTGGSLRDKLKEISSYSNRGRSAATGWTDFIKSKLAFIDNHKLPIRVKYQELFAGNTDIASPDPRYGHKASYQGTAGAAYSAGRSPQWSWLVKEMQDSEDVEMRVGWWDSTGRKGGHLVVITGTAKINGVPYIRIKEDSRQDTAGGTHMPSLHWDSAANGFIRLPEWYQAGTKQTCFVEAFASESPDTSIHFVSSGVDGEDRPHAAFLTLAKNPIERVEPATIDLFVAEPGNYRLYVTDVAGREVAQLTNTYFALGSHQYFWDAGSNPSLAGIYFVVLEGEGKHEMARVVRY